MPLYPTLLGPAFATLPAPIRRLHADPKPIEAAGLFQVRHGPRLLARWLIRLAGMPPAADAVDVRLTIVATDNGEEWRRSFAGKLVASRQWPSADGLLLEVIGPMELRFRLLAVEGKLVYQSAGARLRLGWLRLPLPRWLAPAVSAWEQADGKEDRVDTFVEVRLPLLGLVIAYEGTLSLIGADS